MVNCFCYSSYLFLLVASEVYCCFYYVFIVYHYPDIILKLEKEGVKFLLCKV